MPSANLPIEYQEVEWLESSGTQWLDTGYVPNVDTWAECEYEVTSRNDNWRAWFGNGDSKGLSFSVYGNRIYASAGTASYSNPTASRDIGVMLGSHKVLRLKEDSLAIDDTSTSNKITREFTERNISVVAFATRGNGNSAPVSYKHPGLRLYSLTFFENDIPMVELVPCYRISDEKPGMYDLARNVFLTNQGTGEFMTSRAVYPSHERATTALEMAWRRRALVSKAENRLIPLEYQMVEYLESTGTQWIDTGITPDEGFGFFVDCMPLTNVDTTSASAKILGSSKSDSGHWGGITIGTYAAHNGGQSTWFKNSRNVSLGTYDPGLRSYERVQLENKNNHYTSSTGQSYDTPIHTKNYIYGSLWLFTFHTDIAITTASVRIYSYKAYDGNTTVQNLIPCYRKQDNKPGMYDLISKQFLINQGTGDDFVLGPDV